MQNLGILRSHNSALFSTSFTSLGTLSAMHRMVLLAFPAAPVTDVRADSTNTSNFYAPEAHQISRGIAYCRTFHIQLDARCHIFYIFFFTALTCAIIAD